jgi:transcriptional regulator with XRE-family HTH domain
MMTEAGLMTEHDEVEEERFVPIGERLRLAREAKAMSLEDVANRTRIPIRHLIHIEQEDWEALPAVTYAIGFARNYANVVGLDGAEIAGELRDAIGGPRRRAPAAEYYEPADPARVPPRSLAIAAVIIAILLVVAYLIWRKTLDDGGASIPVTEAPAAPPAPAAAPTPAAPAQAVVLTATGDVWLRISDGEATLFQGTLAAGQTYQLPPNGQHPVLRTGRPQLLRARVGNDDIGPLEASEHRIDGLSLLPQDLAARPRVQAMVPPPAPARALPAAQALQPAPQTPSPPPAAAPQPAPQTAPPPQ